MVLSMANELARRSPNLAIQAFARANKPNAMFDDYRLRKAPRTILNQDIDLDLFSEYLDGIGMTVSANELNSLPTAWSEVTWQSVEGFMLWMIAIGYSTASVSRRLSTVKVYAKLAMRAGSLSTDQQLRIAAVKAYTGQEGNRLDARREATGLPTRIGHKKVNHTSLTIEQATALKRQPDTPQGRRDALLMCILIDHGLRVGEVAALEIGSFDQRRGTMRFYRPKVDLTQTHQLSVDTKSALRAYLLNDIDQSSDGSIWRASKVSHELGEHGWTVNGIQKRVEELGERIEVFNLSPHDCRHYWATRAGAGVEAGKFSLFQLQEAGGWKTLAMPRHYVEWAAIANRGMV